MITGQRPSQDRPYRGRGCVEGGQEGGGHVGSNLPVVLNHTMHTILEDAAKDVHARLVGGGLRGTCITREDVMLPYTQPIPQDTAEGESNTWWGRDT